MEVEVQEDGIIQQAWDHGSHRKRAGDGVDTADPS